MNIYDTFLLNTALVITPIMIYLIFVAYTKTLNKDENNLIFTIILFSEIYLIIKYGIPIYKNLPLTIINLPLVIAYMKNHQKIIIILSIIIILYYYNFYNNFLILIILEYFTYYIISLKLKKPNFIILFSILKTIFIITLMKSVNYQIIISGIVFLVISFFATYLLEKTEDMLKLHKSIKEIENDKQIKTSLFKVTHEIKNPIAVCKGYLDMYDENKEDIKRYIPILKEEIDRTLVLLEDFLSMNKLKINKDILDINLLLEEVTDNMNLLFLKNKIQLDIKIDDDEIYINGDYNRLTQVLINLFKNSIEALEKKKNKKISLWTKTEKNKIKIFIKDNGEGIPKDIMEKIKEPFYTTKAKGTGLGVALSDEIIKAHDGSLKYTSKYKDGTLVTVTLPIEKAI